MGYGSKIALLFHGLVENGGWSVILLVKREDFFCLQGVVLSFQLDTVVL